MFSSSSTPLEFSGEVITPSGIRSFVDIPDIATMEIPPVEYLVPALGIARNTITLWTGPDGDGKTYLAQVMALAVARGEQFLGMACQQSRVLYLDLENPGYVVQERIHSLAGDARTPAELRFWGTWLPIDQQPPRVNSELLLTICKDSKPLLIVDPFRHFHSEEENDSTAMSAVMLYLRACAVNGAAVVILHHPAKTEGSTGRGSSAIRGACDLAFLHSLDKESGLITLKVDKNRLGPSRTITVRADFEEGKFELSEAPYITRRNDELAKFAKIIAENPGITQNGILRIAGGQRQRVSRLLNEGKGTLWTTQPGPKRSTFYFPAITGSVVPSGSGNRELEDVSGSVVPPPKGGNQRITSPEAQRLCATHRFHSDWVLHEGMFVCRLCRPELQQ